MIKRGYVDVIGYDSCSVEVTAVASQLDSGSDPDGAVSKRVFK